MDKPEKPTLRTRPMSQPSSLSQSGADKGPGSLRVSLIPHDPVAESEALFKKRITILIGVLVVETLLLGGIWIALKAQESAGIARRQALTQESAELSTQIAIAESNARDLSVFNAQVRGLQKTLDDHTYWTPIFAYLERLTKPTVSYANFTGDATNRVITLEVTAPTYRDVAEQLVTLQNDPGVLSVRSTSASAQVSGTNQVQGVSFSLVITLTEDIWEKTDFAVPQVPSMSGE